MLFKFIYNGMRAEIDVDDTSNLDKIFEKVKKHFKISHGISVFHDNGEADLASFLERNIKSYLVVDRNSDEMKHILSLLTLGLSIDPESLIKHVLNFDNDDFRAKIIKLIKLIDDPRYNLFMLFVKADHKLIKLIAKNMDIAKKTHLKSEELDLDSDYTLLIHAVVKDNHDFVKSLLDIGSSKFEYSLALSLAVEKDDVKMVDLLIDRVLDINDVEDRSNVLLYALDNSNIDLFIRLLDKGADPSCGYSAIRYLLDNPEWDSGLFYKELFKRGYLINCIKTFSGLSKDEIRECLNNCQSRDALGDILDGLI